MGDGSNLQTIRVGPGTYNVLKQLSEILRMPLSSSADLLIAVGLIQLKIFDKMPAEAKVDIGRDALSALGDFLKGVALLSSERTTLQDMRDTFVALGSEAK